MVRAEVRHGVRKTLGRRALRNPLPHTLWVLRGTREAKVHGQGGKLRAAWRHQSDPECGQAWPPNKEAIY